MKYVETIFRVWPRLVIVCLLLPAALGGAVILLFPSYKATANIWVGDQSAYLGASANPTGWSQYLTPAVNEQETMTQMLKTSAFQDAVSARLDSRRVFADRSERAAALASVANTKVTAEGSRLVSITYTCTRKDLCTTVLQAVIDQFQANLAELQKQNATLGISFLSTQLKSAQSAQTSAEDAVQKYLGDHPGTRVDLNQANGGAGVTSVELQRLIDQLTQARNHVNELQVQLSQAHFIADASAQVVKTSTQILDPPAITRSGLLGDGSSLKTAGIVAAVCWALAAVYIFVTVRLDRSAREAGELEMRLDVPVLAIVPHLGPKDRFPKAEAGA